MAEKWLLQICTIWLQSNLNFSFRKKLWRKQNNLNEQAQKWFQQSPVILYQSQFLIYWGTCGGALIPVQKLFEHLFHCLFQQPPSSFYIHFQEPIWLQVQYQQQCHIWITKSQSHRQITSALQSLKRKNVSKEKKSLLLVA